MEVHLESKVRGWNNHVILAILGNIFQDRYTGSPTSQLKKIIVGVNGNGLIGDISPTDNILSAIDSINYRIVAIRLSNYLSSIKTSELNGFKLPE